MATPNIRTIPIRHCDFQAKVRLGGSGPPLVYLHAAGGPIWDPFVEWLTESFTVYAPHHPGTGETARDSIYGVESLWDLVLIYDEIFDALNLRSVPVIGTSFGGMMACELAAHRPDRVSKLILLDPIGLWREDIPVAPYMLMPPENWSPRCTRICRRSRSSRPCKCRTILMRRQPLLQTSFGRSARLASSSGRYRIRV